MRVVGRLALDFATCEVAAAVSRRGGVLASLRRLLSKKSEHNIFEWKNRKEHGRNTCRTSHGNMARWAMRAQGLYVSRHFQDSLVKEFCMYFIFHIRFIFAGFVRARLASGLFTPVQAQEVGCFSLRWREGGGGGRWLVSSLGGEGTLNLRNSEQQLTCFLAG